VITGSPASITKGNTSDVTVANALTRDTGSLKITKTVDKGGSNFTSGSFNVHVACTGDGGTYDLTISWPTPGSVTQSGIPTGNTCTVTEVLSTSTAPPTGYVWAMPTIDAPVVITKGTTSSITVANKLQTGHVRVVKTVSGAPITATNNCMDVSGTIVGCTFQLRKGATTTTTGTTLEQLNTLTPTVTGTLNFATLVTPGQTYQICEVVLPGWSTSLGTFVPNSFMPPDGVALNPAVDNSILCGNFVAAADSTTTVGNIFTVNNTPPPGGRGLTIGFWKNWSSCKNSNGGQGPVLDETLAKAEPTGIVVSAQSGTYPGFAPQIYLTLHGSTTTPKVAPSACIAVNLLNKSTATSGKKMSSDPAFNLAAQLIAAELNYAAGAGKKPAATTAINAAVVLLGKYQFSGNGYVGTISGADANTMNSLANTLNLYNNNML
jgi:hypothetical protein